MEKKGATVFGDQSLLIRSFNQLCAWQTDISQTWVLIRTLSPQVVMTCRAARSNLVNRNRRAVEEGGILRQSE